jgi:hypothetical protein
MTVTFPHAFRTAVVRLFASTRSATRENVPRKHIAKMAKLAAVCLLALCAAASASAQVSSLGLQSSVVLGPTVTPEGVATDSSGNIYVSNASSNGTYSIIKVSASTHATSTYLSGSLTCGTTSIQLNYPTGLGMDSNNNLYIANKGTSQIIEWNTNTNTCTAYYTGSALGAPSSAQVLLDSSNNLWWSVNSCVGRIPAGAASGSAFPPSNGVGVGFDITPLCSQGSANPFSFVQKGTTYYYYATGIAIAPTTNSLWSAGDLLVADGNSSIWRFTAASNFQSYNVVYGGLNIPYSLVFDSSNNLWVVLEGSGTLIKLSAPSNSYASTAPNMLPGGFSSIYNMAFDPSGNLFVATSVSVSLFTSINALTELCPTGNCATLGTSIGSTSPIYSANFQIPAGTKIGSYNYLEQGVTGVNSEFKVPSSDSNTALCATGTIASATTCSADFVFSPLFPGLHYGAVQVLDPSGNILSTAYVGGVGVGPELSFVPGTQSAVGSGLNKPLAIAADNFGNVFIGNNTGAGNIQKVTAAGVQSTIACCTGLTPSTLTTISAISVDGAGDVYVNDSPNSTSRIIKIPWNGTSYGNPILFLPSAVAGSATVDGNGNIYTATSATISKTTPAGVTSAVPCCTGLTPSNISISANIKVDSGGNVYVGDSANNRVIKIPWNGASYGTATLVGTFANAGAISSIAVDLNGDVYVLAGGNTISVVPWNGTTYGTAYVVATAASNGFVTPTDIALDGSGNLYVVDYGTTKIVKLSGGTAPTLTWATATNVGSKDTTDGSQTVTLQNIGNAPLTILTPTTGNNPSISSGYAYNNSSTCPQLSTVSSPATLAQGVNCTYVLDFTPAAVGVNSGSLLLSDNNLNDTTSKQSIKLTGTGIAAVATLSTTSLNFSSQVSTTTSAPLTVNLQDTGNAPLVISSVAITGTNAGDFVIASGNNTCTGTVAVSGSCSVGVAFAPTALGSRSATLTFTDNATGSPQSVSLLGTGVAAGTQMDWGTLPPTPIVVNGNAGTVTVKEENASKVVVTTATDTITLTVTGPNSYSKTYTQTAVAGIATFNLGSAALPAAGTYTYTAAVTGLTSITATETVNLITPTLNWTPVAPTGGTVTGTGTSTVATIWNPTALGTLLNAYTSSPDTSSCTYTATPTGAAVTSASVLAGGTYTLTVTCTPTGSSVGVYATISSTITLQVNSETITLTPSSAAVQILGSVTLQATVAGTPGGATPTGTVTFYDGTTVLGSGTLVNGAYSLTFIPTVPAWACPPCSFPIPTGTGIHTLSVNYGGDSNYRSGTSASVSETVVNFTLSCTNPTANYSWGQTVVFNCTETPVGSSTFPNAITITGGDSISNGAGSAAWFSSFIANPATIAAGSGTTNFTITVNTKKPATGTYRNPLLPFFSLMLPVLPFTLLLRRRVRHRLMSAVLAVVVLAASLGLCGFDVGSGGCLTSGTPTSTTMYILVTGTSGNLVNTTQPTANI